MNLFTFVDIVSSICLIMVQGPSGYRLNLTNFCDAIVQCYIGKVKVHQRWENFTTLHYNSVSVFHKLEDQIRGKFGGRKFPVKLRQLNSVFSNIRGTQICYYMLLKFSVNNCRTNNCRVCVRVFWTNCCTNNCRVCVRVFKPSIRKIFYTYVECWQLANTIIFS